MLVFVTAGTQTPIMTEVFKQLRTPASTRRAAEMPAWTSSARAGLHGNFIGRPMVIFLFRYWP